MNKRNFLSKFVIMFAAATALSACGGGGDSNPPVNTTTYTAIKLGMDVSQVNAIMGQGATSLPPALVPEIVPHVWSNPPYKLTVSFKNGIAFVKTLEGPSLFLTEMN